MDHWSALRAILVNDPVRWRALAAVRSLKLPDCWVGAGFVRNAVWDHLHDRPVAIPSDDIDVLWFDPARAEPSDDKRAELRLRTLEPNLDWSVKNQARMHARNGDSSYQSSLDAMRYWPEIATAVAVRRSAADQCEIIAPFGLDDLFGLVVRPGPRFAGEKHGTYLDRIRAKRWLDTWPRLRTMPG